MNFLSFQLKNSFSLIKKHKVISLLIIVFIFVSLTLFGKIVGMSEQAEKNAVQYEETYGNKTYYYTSEALSDAVYYEYLERNNCSIYNNLSLFIEKLRNSEVFTYIEIIHQHLEIVSPVIPDKYLLNYEDGIADESKFYYNNELLYATKAIQVSPSFFTEYNITISEGQGFTEKDYYQESNMIPVLLGSEYSDLFQVGDTFESYYITDKFQFIVKGFVSKESFFYSRIDSDMVSCNRYIIMPSIIFQSASEIAKYALLQKFTGIVSSSLGYEETVAVFEEYMKESNVEKLDISIVYPKAAQEGESIFNKYSAMTNEVARQFMIMVLIVMFFGIIATTVSLCSMIRENRLNFGIEMLCGATKNHIFCVSFVYLVFLLLFGDALCSIALLLNDCSSRIISYVQLTVVVMLAVSGLITAVYVAKMPIHDIIGGNE